MRILINERQNRLLLEKYDVKWQKSAYLLAIENWIPITQKIYQRFFGEQTIKSFHIAGSRKHGEGGFESAKECLNNIKSIIGKRNTLSSFNTADAYFVEDIGGVHVTGVLLELEGNLVFDWPSDVMSIPDESGNKRWLRSTTFFDDYLNSKFITELNKMKIDINPILNKITNNTKKRWTYLKYYYNFINKFFDTHNDAIQKKLYDFYMYSREGSGGYNETLINKIKVKSVMWCPRKIITYNLEPVLEWVKNTGGKITDKSNTEEREYARYWGQIQEMGEMLKQIAPPDSVSMRIKSSDTLKWYQERGGLLDKGVYQKVVLKERILKSFGNPENYETLSDYQKKLVCKLTPDALKYINNPSKEMVEIAIEEFPEAIITIINEKKGAVSTEVLRSGIIRQPSILFSFSSEIYGKILSDPKFYVEIFDLKKGEKFISVLYTIINDDIKKEDVLFLKEIFKNQEIADLILSIDTSSIKLVDSDFKFSENGVKGHLVSGRFLLKKQGADITKFITFYKNSLEVFINHGLKIDDKLEPIFNTIFTDFNFYKIDEFNKSIDFIDYLYSKNIINDSNIEKAMDGFNMSLRSGNLGELTWPATFNFVKTHDEFFKKESLLENFFVTLLPKYDRIAFDVTETEFKNFLNYFNSKIDIKRHLIRAFANNITVKFILETIKLDEKSLKDFYDKNIYDESGYINFDCLGIFLDYGVKLSEEEKKILIDVNCDSIKSFINPSQELVLAAVKNCPEKYLPLVETFSNETIKLVFKYVENPLKLLNDRGVKLEEKFVFDELLPYVVRNITGSSRGNKIKELANYIKENNLKTSSLADIVVQQIWTHISKPVDFFDSIGYQIDIVLILNKIYEFFINGDDEKARHLIENLSTKDYKISEEEFNNVFIKKISYISFHVCKMLLSLEDNLPFLTNDYFYNLIKNQKDFDKAKNSYKNLILYYKNDIEFLYHISKGLIDFEYGEDELKGVYQSFVIGELLKHRPSEAKDVLNLLSKDISGEGLLIHFLKFTYDYGKIPENLPTSLYIKLNNYLKTKTIETLKLVISKVHGPYYNPKYITDVKSFLDKKLKELGYDDIEKAKVEPEKPKEALTAEKLSTMSEVEKMNAISSDNYSPKDERKKLLYELMKNYGYVPSENTLIKWIIYSPYSILSLVFYKIPFNENLFRLALTKADKQFYAKILTDKFGEYYRLPDKVLDKMISDIPQIFKVTPDLAGYVRDYVSKINPSLV